MGLPDRLQKIILDSRLSLPEFAKRVGVARNTLVGYRDGEVSPSIDFLEHVCEVFNVDRQWLILGEGCKCKLDMDVLVAVISGVMRALREAKLDMPPEKEAQLIFLLYEYYIGKEEEVRAEVVERYLKLAI